MSFLVDQYPIAMEGALLRYYTDVFLDSNKGTDVIKLTCQEHGDATDRAFTVADMETALGDYFTFTFRRPESAQ